MTNVARFLRELEVADGATASATTFNLMAVLGGLVTLAVVWILVGLISTFRFHRRSNVVVDDRLQDLLSVFDVRLGCSNEIEFRISKQINAPCVTAINQRCVYNPSNWNDFSDDELTASIVHELAHLNRGDARWRLLAQVATAFQVFHPLSHLPDMDSNHEPSG